MADFMLLGAPAFHIIFMALHRNERDCYLIANEQNWMKLAGQDCFRNSH